MHAALQAPAAQARHVLSHRPFNAFCAGGIKHSCRLNNVHPDHVSAGTAAASAKRCAQKGPAGRPYASNLYLNIPSYHGRQPYPPCHRWTLRTKQAYQVNVGPHRRNWKAACTHSGMTMPRGAAYCAVSWAMLQCEAGCHFRQHWSTVLFNKKAQSGQHW